MCSHDTKYKIKTSMYHLISHKTIKKVRNKTQKIPKHNIYGYQNKFEQNHTKCLCTSAKFTHVHTQTNLASGVNGRKIPRSEKSKKIK